MTYHREILTAYLVIAAEVAQIQYMFTDIDNARLPKELRCSWYEQCGLALFSGINWFLWLLGLLTFWWSHQVKVNKDPV